MSAVLNDHLVRRIVHLVAPLQRNPWIGWQAGTTVTRHYEHEDYLRGDCVASRNDIVYEVVEQDKRMHRIEKIRGAQKRQEFLIADEQGLPRARRATAGIDAALMLDGVMVMSVLRKIKMAVTDYERFVNKAQNQWSLSAFPSIILRYESPNEQWSIQSLQCIKNVAGQELVCVEVDVKRQISLDEIHRTTKFLCGRVPGHLVEEQQSYFRKDKATGQHTLQWTSREFVSTFRAR